MAYSWSKYSPFYKRNLKVAGPIIITQVGAGIVQIADNIMVGQLGTIELAASSFANSIFVMGMVFLQNVVMGLTPLVGYAYVQKKHQKTHFLFHNSLLYSLLATLGMCAIYYALIPFFPHMGQDEMVINASIPYFKYLILSLIPYIIFCNFKQLLEGLGNTTIAMYISFASIGINIFLNWIFIYGKWGAPAMGITGAGLATFLTRISQVCLFWGIFHFKKGLSSYIHSIPKASYKLLAIQKLISVGLPIGVHGLMEVSAFALSSIMAGWLGAAALAAHQITMNVANLAFMLVLGIQAGTTIRVSHQYGKRDLYSLKMAANASVHLGVFICILQVICILAFRFTIPEIFSKDSLVIEIAASALVINAVYLIFDGLQAIGAGLLRGISDVKFAMYISFVAYILLNLPCGYIFGFVAGWGIPGIWGGFVVGLGIAALCFHLRFHYRFKEIKKELSA